MILNRLAEELEELAVVEQRPQQDGRNMTMMLAPAARRRRGEVTTAAPGRYPLRPPMPKMKSHSGAKKRFKVTATGKVKSRPAFSSHILEKKSPKKKRALGLEKTVDAPARRSASRRRPPAS